MKCDRLYMESVFGASSESPLTLNQGKQKVYRIKKGLKIIRWIYNVGRSYDEWIRSHVWSAS